MFSFINQSRPNEAPTRDEKRKIRAHVTKSLALQRRREENQLSDAHTAAPDGDSAWRQHKLKKRTSSRVNPAPNIGISKATARAARPFGSIEIVDRSLSQTCQSDAHETESEEQFVSFILCKDGAESRDMDDRVFRRSQTKPEPMLTTWSRKDFQLHGDVMLRICAHQMNHFRPDLTIEQASDITGYVWRESPCTILSYALCLSALGHLQSTSSGTGNDVIGLFKGKVFHEMIKRLPSMDDALPDEMIPSIICLVSFELSRVSLEARTHLQALKTIRQIEERKGILEYPIMVEGLDFIHSLLFDCPTVNEFEMMVVPDSSHVETLFEYLEIEQNNTTGSLKRTTAMQAYISEMLSHLETLMGEILNGRMVEQNESELFFDDLEEFRVRYCTETHGDAEEQNLARCFYHACAIMFNVLINKRTNRNPSNKRHATGLYFALQATSIGSSVLPRLRLWILAVALSASRDAGEQSLFQNHLATAIYRFGVRGWKSVKSFLCSFLRIRSQLDRIAKQTPRKRKTTKREHLVHQITQSTSSSPGKHDTQSETTSPNSSAPRIPSPANLVPPSFAPPTNAPRPRFIPLPAESLTKSVIENAKIYPELDSKYTFGPPIAVENVMSIGYGALCQDVEFERMLLKGESGQMSLIGASIPGVGWVALF